MPRTTAKVSFCCLFLAAFAALAGARADQQDLRPPAFCEKTMPLAPTGLHGAAETGSRDGIIGGDGTTGPTFPRCRTNEVRSAMITFDMEAKHV
jgi:hypothetical protein